MTVRHLAIWWLVWFPFLATMATRIVWHYFKRWHSARYIRRDGMGGRRMGSK